MVGSSSKTMKTILAVGAGCLALGAAAWYFLKTPSEKAKADLVKTILTPRKSPTPRKEEMKPEATEPSESFNKFAFEKYAPVFRQFELESMSIFARGSYTLRKMKAAGAWNDQEATKMSNTLMSSCYGTLFKAISEFCTTC